MEELGYGRTTRRMQQVWSEARVFRTDGGYVLETRARSNGRPDRVWVKGADSALELIAACWIDQRDSRTDETLRLIPKYVIKALDQAAEKDSFIAGAMELAKIGRYRHQ